MTDVEQRIQRAMAQAAYEFLIEIRPRSSRPLGSRIDKILAELPQKDPSSLYRTIEILADEAEQNKRNAEHIGKANEELAAELDRLRSQRTPEYSIGPEKPETHLHFHLSDKHKAYFVEGKAGSEFTIQIDRVDEAARITEFLSAHGRLPSIEELAAWEKRT